MKTKREQREVEALLWEAKIRKMVLRRLSTPLKQAKAAMEKAEEAEQKKRQKLAGYKRWEDAHEAYGWGIITEDELKTVEDILSGRGSEGEQQRTAEAAAYDIMREFAGWLEKEVRSFEWEALPDKEKERIRKANEKMRESARKRSEQ